MAATEPVCPVVGTTNTILPPSHPDFDMDAEGLVCPVTNATTAHHHILHKHPGLPSSTDMNAQACPVLKQTIQSPENRKLDEGICPIVGPVSTILPPDHPPTEGGSDVCPVTKATLKHHTNKVHKHPNVDGAAEGAVCPVVGARK